MHAKILKINERDNVVVALTDMAAGETLDAGDRTVKVREHIEKGHKIACRDIAEGDDVIKYGYAIGHALKDISAGEYVHTHNIRTNLKGIEQYTYAPIPAPGTAVVGTGFHARPFTAISTPETAGKATRPAEAEPPQFMGYVREDGQVGIRNELWIINTVGCVNKTAEILAREANIRLAGRTDGVFAYVHPHGCSQLGGDHARTQAILAGLVRHPNAAGVLVLGLGCENNNINEFKKVLGGYDPRRVKFLQAQDAEDETGEGLKLLEELADYAGSFERQPCPLSRLVVGLKCGGSDAFSGITANPLVGRFSDMLIAEGGTAILSEVPEMFGAETIMMGRCVNRDVFDRTAGLINGFKEYYMRYGQEIYENPSPGNKRGGITTLEEKSLGCILKGGTESVADVLDYGEKVKTAGLNLLEGPGNDIVACTALTAAGAHLILFTTGRGTPLGAPVPTVKISTNTQLYERKRNWIDFDAGCILARKSMEEAGDELYKYVADTASGLIRTKNEENGYKEIAIFKDGATL